MKLKITSNISGKTETINVNSRQDLLDIASRYPRIYDQVSQSPFLEDALLMLAKYIGSHHMDAEVINDEGKIEDDFNSFRAPVKEIKDLNDAARLFENNDEEVDIPESVALEGSTHRW